MERRNEDVATLMSHIDYLIGSENILTKPLRVFDAETCAFLADFSKAIMADNEAKGFPDIISLGFWCRQANIQRMSQRNYCIENRIGRGLAFHIAPSNIPVNFAFSLVISALAGNSNIVRVPSRPMPQIMIIARLLMQVLDGYPNISNRNALVSYAADTSTTAAFCAKADVRIVWGGDKTVNSIRAISSKPRCLDICFPDRFSIAIIDGEALSVSDDVSLKVLARNFFNDTYLMDQEACSSPRVILWKHPVPEAKTRFWEAIELEALERYNLQPSSAIDKFTRANLDAVLLEGHLNRIEQRGNLLYRLSLNSVPTDAGIRLRGSCGYFYEIDLTDFSILKKLVTEQCQTVTYFGIDPKTILDYVFNEGLTGIDRIVPIGSALDIGIIWDGFELISSLSRLVDVH